MERLISIASPLGLYAEEYDTSTGRHLGNFPQAFSHLALVNPLVGIESESPQTGRLDAPQRGSTRQTI